MLLRQTIPIECQALRNRSNRIKKRPADFQWGGEEDMAFNHIENKDGLLKPKHTVEEQIAYMNSETFLRTYKGEPIFHWYKRNFKGQWKLQPPPRLHCLDKDGRFNLNNACPVCRDEYLFFDYQNPKLIEMFLCHGTDQPLPILQTGLCREQYIQLQVQLLKAKENGTMPFLVEFRHYDYADWYPDWVEPPETAENEKFKESLMGPLLGDDKFWNTRTEFTIDSVYPNPPIVFDAHNRDTNTLWDQWWLRVRKCAKVGRKA